MITMQTFQIIKEFVIRKCFINYYDKMYVSYSTFIPRCSTLSQVILLAYF